MGGSVMTLLQRGQENFELGREESSSQITSLIYSKSGN